MRFAILTSGGDAPGMNAAIRAATMVGLALGHEPFGVAHGYRGLLEGRIAPLAASAVSDILRSGGTVLHSARCPEFHQPDARQRARDALDDAGIEGLVVIGGNGSLTGADLLGDPAEAGDWPVGVVGIPASIDNDIALTSLSIGVDTAMNTIVEACDRIADTASAHNRVFIVEVMGRDCGYLAMASAVAAGADMVLFPEADRTEEELVTAVVDAVLAVRARDEGAKVIAIKAEGIDTPTDRLKDLVDSRLARTPDIAPTEIETRVTVLGHVVRGGRPSAFDRLLGSRMGNVAVRALASGRSGEMVAWQPPVDAVEGIGERSAFDPYCHLMPLDVVLDATRELLEGQSPLARWRSTIFEDLQDVFLV